MGRELKRVALDFQWPLNKVWQGFINPYRAEKCPDCELGYSAAGWRMHQEWYGNVEFDPVAYDSKPISPDHPAIREFATRSVDRNPEYFMHRNSSRQEAIERETKRLHEVCIANHWNHHLNQADVDALIAADRLWDFTRVPRDAGQAFVIAMRMVFHNTNSWLPADNGYRPTPDEVNDYYLFGLGGPDMYTCMKARCEREGVEMSCASCDGSAEYWASSELKARHDAWVAFEPPAGSGYQLWETTSEGSPISPVFETLDELCKFAAKNCSTFGQNKATVAEWREMLDNNHVYHQEGNIVYI